MKLLLHFLAIASCSLAGWRLGGVPTPALQETASPSTSIPRTVHQASGRVGALSEQLSALRCHQGGDPEIQWAKWCLQVPDKELPQAIAALNPQREHATLLLLYERWAKLDFTVAWNAFIKSGLPLESSQIYLPGRQDYGFTRGRLNAQPRASIALKILESYGSTQPADAEKFCAQLLQDQETLFQLGLDAPQMESLMAQIKNRQSSTQHLVFGQLGNQEIYTSLDEWLKTEPRPPVDWLQKAHFGPYDPGLRSLTTQTESLSGRDQVMLGAALDKQLMTQSAEFAAMFNYRRFHPNGCLIDHALPQIDMTLTRGIRRWAREDAEAAQNFVQKMSAGEVQSQLLGELAGQIAAQQPSQAIALVNQLEINQQDALRSMVSGWVENAPEPCLQWLQGIPDATMRQAAAETVAGKLAAGHPDLALQATALMDNDREIKNVVNRVRANLFWNPAEQVRLRKKFPQLPW